MSEATSINAKIYVPGKKGTKLQRQLTFEIISEWIKLQGFDDYTTNGLIEMAAKYPTQALPSFRKNFNLMIDRVRQKRKEEQNISVNEENDDSISERNGESAPRNKFVSRPTPASRPEDFIRPPLFNSDQNGDVCDIAEGV